MTSMTDKERFDAYMKLADYWTARGNARREIQWKVNLAFWALMVAAIYSIKTRPPEGLLVETLAFAAFVHVWVWVTRIWMADYGVRHTAVTNVEMARAILEGREPRESKRLTPSMLDFFADWQAATQVLTTLLLLFAAYYLIGTSAVR